jgi:CRP-like cAMP-binding protein
MQDIQKTTAAGSVGEYPGCAFCMIYNIGLCSRAKAGGPSSNNANIDGRPIESSSHTALAGQMILHPREPSEFVMFICSGQAISSVGLADGRRQIFEVLLPGDIVLWTALFEPMSGRLIEAIDDSTYRKLKRTEFQALLVRRPDLFEMFMRLCSYKKNQCDQLALTLGRRNAAQRIARLILDLAKRFTERGLMGDETFRFPLRQRHIADATGLTPVHTSKVLRQLQRDKIIEYKNRSLKIFDMMRLRQVAGP